MTTEIRIYCFLIFWLKTHLSWGSLQVTFRCESYHFTQNSLTLVLCQLDSNLNGPAGPTDKMLVCLLQFFCYFPYFYASLVKEKVVTLVFI